MILGYLEIVLLLALVFVLVYIVYLVFVYDPDEALVFDSVEELFAYIDTISEEEDDEEP